MHPRIAFLLVSRSESDASRPARGGQAVRIPEASAKWNNPALATKLRLSDIAFSFLNGENLDDRPFNAQHRRLHFVAEKERNQAVG